MSPVKVALPSRMRGYQSDIFALGVGCDPI